MLEGHRFEYIRTDNILCPPRNLNNLTIAVLHMDWHDPSTDVTKTLQYGTPYQLSKTRPKYYFLRGNVHFLSDVLSERTNRDATCVTLGSGCGATFEIFQAQLSRVIRPRSPHDISSVALWFKHKEKNQGSALSAGAKDSLDPELLSQSFPMVGKTNAGYTPNLGCICKGSMSLKPLCDAITKQSLSLPPAYLTS